jgi:hypothetical protein
MGTTTPIITDPTARTLTPTQPLPAQPVLAFRSAPWLCLALVVAADVLFYQAPRGEAYGWIMGGFLAALLVAVAANHPALLKSWTGRLLFALETGLCAALVEDPSALALILFTAGFGALVFAEQCMPHFGTIRWLGDMCMAPFFLAERVVVDAAAVLGRTDGLLSVRGLRNLSVWVLPLGFAAVFAMLFATANPVFLQWFRAAFAAIDFSALVAGLDRVVFAGVVAIAAWVALRSPLVRFGGPDAAVPRSVPTNPGQPDVLVGWLFSTAAVIRSMVVFNVMFAIQNGFDLLYLWGGQTLPAGATYAGYAHASAYPLMVTALIAAAFVLIAFRPGNDAGQARLARPLMYLWILQNVVLVVSAVKRTWAYVGEYSLTSLRVAALVWMALVAAGLLLVIVRFAAGRSNRWLFGANCAALAGVLYISCFVDFGGLIADYNVANCREMTGRGALLDRQHLIRLGVGALPALRKSEVFAKRDVHSPDGQRLYVWEQAAEAGMIRQLQTGGWRGWTWLGHRVKQRLQ